MHACTAHTLGQAPGASPKGDRDDASCGQHQKGWPSEDSSAWIVVGHPFDAARELSVSTVAMGSRVD
jgi:hypothetical protein